MCFNKEIYLISKNYCIGCGVCTMVEHVSIGFDEYGKYKVNFNDLNDSEYFNVLKICPFSSLAYNEDKISSLLFDKNIKNNAFLGSYLNNYVGYVKEEYRLKSSSGGIITWLLLNLLKSREITYAVFVGESKCKNFLFEYKISKNEKDILAGASSKYYPVELSEVLKTIEEREGQYAIVALPCFVKGIRLLQMQYPVFKERIKFIISPVCGHLKTKHYSEFLAWQKGLNPKKLVGINFRKKFSDLHASQYGTEFRIKEAEEIKTYTFKNNSFELGTDWGHGMFKYPVCDYCDDVFGELSDISVGDAWLKDYTDDYKGNSIITIRNIDILKFLMGGVKKDELSLQHVESEPILLSQAGGIRNKKEDLAYRLYLKNQADEWYPPKRVKPECNISKKRQKIIKLRMDINFLSHELFNEAIQKKDIKVFLKKMKPLISSYNHLYYSYSNKVKKIFKNVLMLLKVYK